MMSWNRETNGTVLTIGGVDVPFEIEPYHFLLIGSTGTGKTITIDEMLSTVIDRGDRVIVCDPNGHHLSQFYRAGDVVLNPFDRRSMGWGIFNEVRRDFDCDRLARSIVPEGRGPDAQWHFYAQVLLSETLRALLVNGETSTEALMHFAASASREELEKLLAGSPAVGLFDTDAARALASTRFILTTHLNAHKYMPPGTFSLREWLEEGEGNLYLTWREDMHTALKPLITTWVEILANAMLSLAPHRSRRLWLVLDELGALGRLGSLEDLLTRGRKYGVVVVAGLQAIAQLDRTYGRESATVLRSCFRNVLVLGVARSDPETAEMLSRSLGEQEVEREQLSMTESRSGGVTHSVSSVRSVERVAMGSELNELPDLTGYLALAGDRPIAVIQLAPTTLPKIAIGIEE